MGSICQGEKPKELEPNIEARDTNKEELLQKMLAQEEKHSELKQMHFPQNEQTISFENQMSPNALITYNSLAEASTTSQIPSFEYRFPDGSYYNGKWKYKKKDGRGKQIWADGSFYVGCWVDGHQSGKGRLIFANGDYYEGDFKSKIIFLTTIDGLPNGHGKFNFFDKKTEYVGDVWNGKMHGMGKETWKDGSFFEGCYENDNKNGPGRFIWADGSEFSGDMWKNNIYGRGKFSWKDGRSYTGTFKNNKMNGEGEFIWGDGSKYIGGYCEDEKEGYGELFLANGKIIKGKWKEGKLVGRSVFVDVNGVETVQEEPEKAIAYEKEIKKED